MSTVPAIRFPLASPVEPHEVLSRDGLVTRAVNRLVDGHDWVLTGPPRIGKSAIVGAVQDYARRQGADVVAIDLRFLLSQEDLNAHLVRGIRECRTGLWTNPSPGQALEPWLDSVSPMDKWVAALSLAESVASRDDRQLIVLFDGWYGPRIWRYFGGAPAIRRWSALRHSQRHTAYGFIGRRANQLMPYMSCPPHDAGASVDHLSVASIPWSEWETYLTDQFKTVGWTLGPAAATRLQALTSGHPWAMMAILQQTVLVTQSEGRTRVTATDVGRGHQRALKILDGLYAMEWVDVRESRTAPHFLAALARGQRLPLTSTVRAGRRYLQSRGIIDAAGHLSDPLFGAWLRDTL